jgi:hypothetical protein
MLSGILRSFLFLEMLRRELSEEETASPSFVQGILFERSDDENPRPHRERTLGDVATKNFSRIATG